jgi:hypothetical protein
VAGQALRPPGRGGARLRCFAAAGFHVARKTAAARRQTTKTRRRQDSSAASIEPNRRRRERCAGLPRPQGRGRRPQLVRQWAALPGHPGDSQGRPPVVVHAPLVRHLRPDVAGERRGRGGAGRGRRGGPLRQRGPQKLCLPHRPRSQGSRPQMGARTASRWPPRARPWAAAWPGPCRRRRLTSMLHVEAICLQRLWRRGAGRKKGAGGRNWGGRTAGRSCTSAGAASRCGPARRPQAEARPCSRQPRPSPQVVDARKEDELRDCAPACRLAAAAAGARRGAVRQGAGALGGTGAARRQPVTQRPAA